MIVQLIVAISVFVHVGEKVRRGNTAGSPGFAHETRRS